MGKSQQLDDAAERCRAFRAKRVAMGISPDAHAAIRKAMERSRNYRNQSAIESIKLPFGQPGADSYGPNGEQRFNTRQAYLEAGKRFYGGQCKIA